MGMAQNATIRGPQVLVFGSFTRVPFFLTHSQIEMEMRRRARSPLCGVTKPVWNPNPPSPAIEDTRCLKCSSFFWGGGGAMDT